MAYNSPDPSKHRWCSAKKRGWHLFCSMLITAFAIFAIFFMQLWGRFPGAAPVATGRIVIPSVAGRTERALSRSEMSTSTLEKVAK